MLNSGYGWMYTIIVIEVVLLILLLYIGLWWNDEDNVAIIDLVWLHCFFFIGLFLGLNNRNDDNNWIWSYQAIAMLHILLINNGMLMLNVGSTFKW